MKSEFYTVLGERIKEIRLASSMTREELAHALGLSAMAIYNYEHGARKPPVDVLAKIATITDQPIESFFAPIPMVCPTCKGTGKLKANVHN